MKDISYGIKSIDYSNLRADHIEEETKIQMFNEICTSTKTKIPANHWNLLTSHRYQDRGEIVRAVARYRVFRDLGYGG